jgi:hypothetical protein
MGEKARTKNEKRERKKEGKDDWRIAAWIGGTDKEVKKSERSGDGLKR